MGLTLHYHPLASYCWKVLIALYENDTPFEGHVVDLMDSAEARAFRQFSPLGKMPALQDDTRGRTIVETSVIMEYLDRHYPGPTRFLPEDPEEALRVRFAERFFDFYVQEPMSKIVTDKIRPEGNNDLFGVEKARAELATAYDAIEARLPRGMWPEGEDFTLADCAALPSLFYAGKVQPFGETHPKLAAYYDRLARRPSFKRVLEEAEPYFRLFPG
jgi:glutathione S-transferase